MPFTRWPLYCPALYSYNTFNIKVEIFNAATNALLESQNLSYVTTGKYLVFGIQGHVKIKVSKLSGGASVAGLFFDPANSLAQPVRPPQFNLRGGTYGPGTPVTLSCGTPGAVIHYTTDGSEPTSESPIYTSFLSLAQTTSFKAKAFVNNVGASATTTIACTVDANLAAACLSGADTTTLGTWKGNYGTDGWWIAYDPSANAKWLPSYATVSLTGQEEWSWSLTDTNMNAPQQTDRLATQRVMAYWGTSSNMTFDVNLTDNTPHQVALYCAALNSYSTFAIKAEVFDAASNALIESQNFSYTSAGKYLVFVIRGHVKIKITRLSGGAGVSGLFFDPAGSLAQPVRPPQFNLRGGTYGPGTPVTISCGTSGAVIHYTTDGSEPTSESPVYTAPLNLAQTTTFKVKAFVNGVGDSATATITCAVDANLAAACLSGADTTTLGTWKGNYGTDGWWIAYDPSANAKWLPSYATVSLTGQEDYTYSLSSTDAIALQKADTLATDRVGAYWGTSNYMTFDVNLTDNALHQVALYCPALYSYNTFSIKVEVFDATVNTLLESQNISYVTTGKYLVFNIKGHVKIKVTKLSGGRQRGRPLFRPRQQPRTAGPSAPV